MGWVLMLTVLQSINQARTEEAPDEPIYYQPFRDYAEDAEREHGNVFAYELDHGGWTAGRRCMAARRRV